MSINIFRQLCCQVRQFSTSSPVSKTFFHVVNRKQRRVPEIKIGDPVSRILARPVAKVPPYPYGESNIYKQSNRGLYGGKFIFTGHQISEFGQKHLRYIRPNVQRHKLWSEALNVRVRCRVVNSVLKTITKEGGLDNYLIKDTPQRIKELGPFGWKMRYKVLRKMEDNERYMKRKEARDVEAKRIKNDDMKVEGDGQELAHSR